MNARADALYALRERFAAGRGALHELAGEAGFSLSDIAAAVASDDWYGRRAAIQCGRSGDITPSIHTRFARTFAALEEVVRAWIEDALQAPGRAKPLELRAMVHVVRELKEAILQNDSGSGELPPPRRFRAASAAADTAPIRPDSDSRFVNGTY